MQTQTTRESIIGRVEHDQQAHAIPTESALAHPLAAVRRRAAALREIRDAGESPIALLVVMAGVVSFIAPLVAFVIFLALTAAHYAA